MNMAFAMTGHPPPPHRSVFKTQILVQAMDADDAMGSYDPWGTGKYKGFDIKKDVPRGPEEDIGGSAGGGGGDDGAGTAVSFKKRKGVGGKGKFRKKARDDQDGD